MFLHNRVKQNWLAFQSLFVEKLSVNILFFFLNLDHCLLQVVFELTNSRFDS